MLKLLKLSFLPKSPDYGLLILRVALGFSMLLLHGRGKMLNFAATAEKMNGLLGLPGNVNAGLAVFAEVASWSSVTPHTSRSASTSVQNCTSAATGVPMRVCTSGRTSGHTSSRSHTSLT